jgi:hypothetical protein
MTAHFTQGESSWQAVCNGKQTDVGVHCRKGLLIYKRESASDFPIADKLGDIIGKRIVEPRDPRSGQPYAISEADVLKAIETAMG